MKCRRLGSLLAIAVGLAACSAAAAPTFVVFPAGNTATEGNAASIAPLDIADTLPGFYAGARYQQVYDHSGFPAGTTQITQIAFRPDFSQGLAFDTTLPDITIRLSVTSKTDTTLSSTFADNFGPSVVTIHTGALHMSSANTGSPRAFDMIIPLPVPFAYNPASGNLLLDITNNTNTLTSIMDFNVLSNHTTARAYAFSSSATTADAVDPDRGLVTQFAVTVPEPAGLLPMGVMIGLAWRRRRATRNIRPQ